MNSTAPTLGRWMACCARLQIPMLETVEEMIYPTEDVFDTEYHLNLKGKLKRSEKIAACLAQALGQLPVPPTKVP